MDVYPLYDAFALVEANRTEPVTLCRPYKYELYSDEQMTTLLAPVGGSESDASGRHYVNYTRYALDYSTPAAPFVVYLSVWTYSLRPTVHPITIEVCGYESWAQVVTDSVYYFFQNRTQDAELVAGSPAPSQLYNLPTAFAIDPVGSRCYPKAYKLCEDAACNTEASDSARFALGETTLNLFHGISAARYSMYLVVENYNLELFPY